MNKTVSLVFKGDHGNTREISQINAFYDTGQPKTGREIVEEAYQTINQFCSERNFKIYYTRICNRDGKTIFDVGSHSEFFHLIPEVNFNG